MNHKYFEYDTNERLISPNIINDVVADILNHFSESKKSKKEWRYVAKGFTVYHNDEVKFKILFSRLKEKVLADIPIDHKIFSHDIFRKRLRSKWLDNDTSLTINAPLPHKFDIQSIYGEKYPIKYLELKHPGRTLVSLIGPITIEIIECHNWLVQNSNDFFEVSWLQ